MDNLPARMEINDALANIALAERYLALNDTNGAHEAWIDAEAHYKRARSMVTRDNPGVIQDNIEKLKIKLGQLRTAIVNSSRNRAK